MAQSPEEKAAIEVANDNALSDEAALEEVMAICARPGEVLEFELNGEAGDYGAYIKYERTAATLNGSQHAYRRTLKRELGRIAVCAFRAGEGRGLELIEYDQKLQGGPVVLIANIEKDRLEGIPKWRETSLSPWVSTSDLHDLVAEEVEIEEDWVHTLTATDR